MKAYKPMGYFLLIILTTLLLVGCGSTTLSKLGTKDNINGIWEWTRQNNGEETGSNYLYFEDNYFLSMEPCDSLDDIQTLNDFAKQAKSQNKEFADTTIPEIIKEMKKMAPHKGLKLMDYEEYINFYEQQAKESDWDRDSLKSLEQVINLFKNQGYTVTENDIYCVGNFASFALLENGNKLGIFSFENRWSSTENLRIEIFTKYNPENNK